MNLLSIVMLISTIFCSLMVVGNEDVFCSSFHEFGSADVSDEFDVVEERKHKYATLCTV
jgi:hypothetical protein